MSFSVPKIEAKYSAMLVFSITQDCWRALFQRAVFSRPKSFSSLSPSLSRPPRERQNQARWKVNWSAAKPPGAKLGNISVQSYSILKQSSSPTGNQLYLPLFNMKISGAAICRHSPLNKSKSFLCTWNSNSTFASFLLEQVHRLTGHYLRQVFWWTRIKKYGLLGWI